MTTTEAEAEGNERFPDLWEWLPDKMWLYAVIFFYVVFVWLFFPIVFILGLVVFCLWFTA